MDVRFYQGGKLIDNVDYAIFANDVYNTVDERLKKVGNFYYDRQLSDDETGIWVNQKKKTVIIGFRGTSFNTASRAISDFGNDTAIATGTFKLSPRFKRGVKKLKEVEAKYDNWNIIITGHSLGARQSFEVAKLCDDIIGNECSAMLYNTGSSPIEIFKTVKPYRADIIDHHIDGDPISAPFHSNQKGIKKVTKQVNNKGLLNKHSMDNFLVD